mmetsp:Transcript_83072/g.240409  ORF Transcript_83072/g.240409 Transcript_83072/m.240409 type:complete len:255 (-) Transcript_83072:340-1104(-)
MDHRLLQVLVGGLDILFRRQPHQPLLMDEDAQWVAPDDQHIQAQIELEAVQQEGLVDVTLRDIRRREVHRHLLDITDEEDALALAPVVRLHDEGLVLRRRELLLEVGEVGGKNPSVGEKLVLLRELLAHAQQVASQIVLASNAAHSYEVVHLLVGFQFHEPVGRDRCVAPKQVEVVVRRRGLLPILEAPTYLRENVVLRLEPVHYLAGPLRRALASLLPGAAHWRDAGAPGLGRAAALRWPRLHTRCMCCGRAR